MSRAMQGVLVLVQLNCAHRSAQSTMNFFDYNKGQILTAMKSAYLKLQVEGMRHVMGAAGECDAMSGLKRRRFV